MDSKQIDKKLDKISKKISFFAINPINEEQEKKKFYSSKRYNPVFEYESYKEDVNSVVKELRTIRPEKTVIGRLLSQTKNVYIQDLYMLGSRGTSKFTKYSIKCYGSPDAELVKLAKEILKKLSKTTADNIIKKMKYAFLKYGVNWSIKEKDMVAHAAVKQSTKEVLIRKNSMFSSKFLKRLIVHEIGTHVVRADNGMNQPYKLFARGLPGYLMTEEGLAVINEELNGCLDANILKGYAARVIAVDMALECSFRKTYNYLAKFLPKEKAWKTTLRAKRGISDTSLPGGCTKDIAYLKGYLELKKFISNGGDLTKLYYGKIGVQHVNLMEKIPGLIEPELLPAFRYTRFLIVHFSDILKSIIILDIPPFNIFPLKQPVNLIREKIFKEPLYKIISLFGVDIQ